jgi:chloramphenicol O-acetyltransferase
MELKFFVGMLFYIKKKIEELNEFRLKQKPINNQPELLEQVTAPNQPIALQSLSKLPYN